MLAQGFGYRVSTTLVPGMTGTDAAQRQPATAQYPETFNSGKRIAGTGGHKPAMVSQPGADDEAVSLNKYQNEFAHAKRFYASGHPVSVKYFYCCMC